MRIMTHQQSQVLRTIMKLHGVKGQMHKYKIVCIYDWFFSPKGANATAS